mgnify:CR=1 FL=1|jgi:hypothetical protein
MTKRKTTKKKVNKKKESSDWFDTHVEVMGVNLSESKKIKALLKERLTKDLSKSQYNLQ